MAEADVMFEGGDSDGEDEAAQTIKSKKTKKAAHKKALSRKNSLAAKSEKSEGNDKEPQQNNLLNET